MYSSHLLSSRKGFSIIVALATTGILLVIVAGIASLTLGEMRLTRLLYDDILTENQAEGVFEYAMLKVRNHREGFADSMESDDIDAVLFSGSSERNQSLRTSYRIDASTGSALWTVPSQSHLILPLFVGNGDLISTRSRDPRYGAGVSRISKLTLTSTASLDGISWSIVAMSGSENVSLAGSGKIDGNEMGTMRLRGQECFADNGTKIDCNGVVAETLDYFYDKTGRVSDFLSSKSGTPFANMSITDPYILIFNNSSGETSFTLSSDSVYALPTLEVTAIAEKGNSRKVLEFKEDKSKYYDALKYGVYNTEN